MAHKVIDGTVIIDWTTGDPEGDRAYLFKAYRAFLKEIVDKSTDNGYTDILDIFEKWQVHDLDIDDFPRINIGYPE